MSNPWLSQEVAIAQRSLVDRQLQSDPWPQHFRALADAVLATGCPGVITEIGCGSGYGREVLDRAGVPYRSYSGVDINPTAIDLAKERYPESEWWLDGSPEDGRGWPLKADVLIDGSCVLHVEKWREHLAALCRASRRWVILHRIPLATGMQHGTGAWKKPTHGYGREFDAWEFGSNDLQAEMQEHGFELQAAPLRADNSWTFTFVRPRHWVTYCDKAYLPRLRALHASMKRHCGPFVLHVLAYDAEVAFWAESVGCEVRLINDFIAEHRELEPSALPGPPRSRVEHMWTCGPEFLVECMERTGEPVTYVDADVMFFSSPEPVFAEIGGAPAAVVPHGFASASAGLPGPTAKSHEIFGRFNVGIVHVRDVEFAKRWSEQCREWCFERLEAHWDSNVDDAIMAPDGSIVNVVRFGDQAFLNDWGKRGAHVIQHPGACLGPWAVHTRALDVRDGVIHFGNRPLVAYHFSALKLLPHGYDVLTRPEYQLTERQADILYRPYLAALQESK